MTRKKVIINFGAEPTIWIPPWHPCAPCSEFSDEAEQFDFFREVVAQVPGALFEVLFGAILDEAKEREANAKAGRGPISTSQWERVHLPRAGDAMWQ